LSRNFTSDNVTPACAQVLEAVVAANADLVPSYGADRYSQRLRDVVSEVFETPVAVFPVATGTAANALALAQLAPPYGGVYCHDGAHIVTDECGAPEFYMGGAKLLGLPARDGKITAAQLSAAVAHAEELGVHHVKPAAVSLTQATEWGTVYSPAQIGEIAAVAREHRLPVHIDGARFANALCFLGASPAAATWKAGVDVLSLGATKNGALCAEAVVFFNPALAENFDRRRKQGGHLWSKLRFLSAQLLAYFEGDLWLRNARNANAMAARLAQGLRAIRGAQLLQAVEANEVFAALPEPIVLRLEREGFGFYRWPYGEPGAGVPIRLVTSYATKSADVDALVAAAGRAADGG
jgi:threonine aldolase